MPSPPPPDLTTCEAEPIHIPGRIQPHGALLVLTDPGLTVSQASANAGELLGAPGADLAGRALSELLAADALARLTAAAAHPDPRPLAPVPCEANGRTFDAILHRHADRLILELEPVVAGAETDPDRMVRFTLVNLRNGLHLKPFCEAVAREVRALTGYDRVMVYRFDADWNGEVFAEDKRGDLEPFLGLHYPASDIPAQARRLYHLNLVRHIPTITYTSAPLVPELDPGTGRPLDLSHAVLRSVSPIHVEYLQNMGVAGTLTISLLKDGRLWGLVACHHYAPRFLPYRVRAACESLGVIVSLQLSAKEDAEELRCRVAAQARLGALSAALAGTDPAAALARRPDDLAALARAGGAAVAAGGGLAVAGRVPDAPEIQRVVDWLVRNGHGDFETRTLPAALPGADPRAASGLLALALGGGDYLLWFRPEAVAAVHWAGDPHYKGVMVGPNGPRLTPRGSFALWKEEQRGRAEPWDECDRDAARTLRAAVLAALARRATELVTEGRRRDEFLATLAHELRNPLAPIRNALEVMRLTGGEAEPARRARELVGRQVGQMVRLIDDLMDVSRISQGKIVLKRERVPLAAAVAGAVEASAPLVEAAGHRLTVAPGPDGVALDADPARLHQVLLNLLNNAAKYTERGGRITVAARYADGWAEVSVADTGVGIAADMLPKVFDLFTQVDRSLEKAQGGLGIGLSLVRRLVELHGGTVEARSEGVPGKGSEFVVRLPATVAGSAPTGAGEPSSLVPGRGRRVLIADDNADAAESLADLLRLLGHEVRTARDGLAAVAAARDARPEVALLDIGMPRLNGYDAGRRIREHLGGAVVLVAVTGWGQEADRQRTAAAGFDYHLVKPVDLAELQRILAPA